MAAPHCGQGTRGMSSQPFQSIVLWNGHHLLSSFVLLSQINFYWFIISLRFYDFIITRIFITYLFIHFLHSNTLKSCMLWENLEFCAREWFGHLKSDPRPSPNRMMFRREMAIIARVHENMKSMLEWITSNKIPPSLHLYLYGPFGSGALSWLYCLHAAGGRSSCSRIKMMMYGEWRKNGRMEEGGIISCQTMSHIKTVKLEYKSIKKVIIKSAFRWEEFHHHPPSRNTHTHPTCISAFIAF